MNWFARMIKQLFGWPPDNAQQVPPDHPPRRSTPIDTHTSTFTSHSSTVHFSDPTPIIVDPMMQVNSVADNLDRQADRYDNAGDTARAAELREAATEIRDGNLDYSQAEAIAAQVDSGYVSDGGDFGTNNDYSNTGGDFDTSSGVNVDDPMDSSYSDNS